MRADIQQKMGDIARSLGDKEGAISAYRHALQSLGVAAHEAWMVGDNLEWEVVAPQRLGIYAIWYDGYGVGLPEGSAIRPDRIIRALPELLA